MKPETFTLSAKSFAYNGEVRKPTVTVKDRDGNKLVKGTDFDLAYSSGCKNVGKYNVYVQLRTYKTVNGTKYVSGWTTKKKTTTKA